MNTTKRLLAYVGKHKSRLIIAGVCSALLAGCNLLSAALVKVFLSAASTTELHKLAVVKYGLMFNLIDPHNLAFTLMRLVAVLFLLITIPKAIFGYISSYSVASATNRVGNDVRNTVYAHLQTLPLRFFHKSRIGDLMSRMNSDVSIIQQSSQVVMQAIDGPIMIVAGLTRMLFLSWHLSILTIIVVPLMGIAIDRISRKIKSLTIATQASIADVNSNIEETVRGVRIIKSFGMENHEIKRFHGINHKSLVAALKAARRNSAVLPFIELMGGIATSLIIYIGGLMIVKSYISLPLLAEFILIAFMVAGAAKSFGRLNVVYQQVIAAATRIFEVLDTKNEMPESKNAVELKEVRGEVVFDKVDFEYNQDEPVLKQLSFKIEPGEVIGVVGPSGAGKSTIADLVSRFYDVSDGSISIDGIDIREIKTSSLRQVMAMVPQETILFSGSIAENIAYGKPEASMEEIISASKAANVHGFVEKTPNGYNTILGEAGVGLSGGQRQRIAIARAILKDPKILILDEATSSLDAESEGIVQEALEKLMVGRTTLIIAHRLSTVKNAHRILVLDHGRVVESGSFNQLMGNEGTFSQLYKTQNKEN